MEKSTKKTEILRAVKYACVALSAGVIQVAATFLLNGFVFKGEDNYYICYLIGLVLSVIWNFTLNRRYTFNAANKIAPAMVKVACYYLVFTPLSTWWVDALVNADFWGIPVTVVEVIVQIGTMLVNLITEYIFQRLFVFGKAIDTRNENK